MSDKVSLLLSDSGPMDGRLAAALDSWRSWCPAPLSKPVIAKQIAGGKTNHSWLLETDCGPAVLRLNCADGDKLGIDRQREHTILLAVVAAGIAPPLWYNDPAAGFMVSGYIDGRVWCEEDFERPSSRQKLSALVDRYASLPVQLRAFDYLAHLDHYHHQLQSSGHTIPAELVTALQRWRNPIAAWQQNCWKPQLTHHDLTPANIIENDSGIAIIDWEYAAMGCTELDHLAVAGNSKHSPVVSALLQLMNDYWLLVRQEIVAVNGCP